MASACLCSAAGVRVTSRVFHGGVRLRRRAQVFAVCQSSGLWDRSWALHAVTRGAGTLLLARAIFARASACGCSAVQEIASPAPGSYLGCVQTRPLIVCAAPIESGGLADAIVGVGKAAAAMHTTALLL